MCLGSARKTKSDCDSVTDVCCRFVRLNAGEKNMEIVAVSGDKSSGEENMLMRCGKV
jgi:hypothetical protein